MAGLYAPPRRLTRLFSLSAGTTMVTTDSGLASAIVATQTADRVVATENSGRASSDGSAPFECSASTSAGMTGGKSLPIEATATARSDRGAVIESPALLRRDMSCPAEWSGVAQFVVDAVVPLEGAAVVHGGASALTEAVALLLPRAIGPLEWLATGGADTELTAETLSALAQGTRGSIEWLGTEATIIADAMLPLEWQGTTPALLLSLESAPGRIRLLATPGRVRLARRN
ncbi:MAG: hypothetical protein ACREE9_01370 [Stellaceae bacterium]